MTQEATRPGLEPVLRALQPTVLADVAAAAQVAGEEVFGPVVSLRTVKSVQEDSTRSTPPATAEHRDPHH
jgi:acyl-CoA reductase-like NAD-dependent aldehyde dehydrogenase